MIRKNTFAITATFFIATNVLPVNASNTDTPSLSPLSGTIEYSMKNQILSINNNATLNSDYLELAPSYLDPMPSLILGGLYGTDGGNLYLINKDTGEATLIGPHGPVESFLGALAFDSNGILYAISAGASAQLYTVDPTTGAATPVGPLGIGFVFEGGLWFNTDDQLFGVDQGDAGAAKTFTINTATGAATIVGPNPGEPRDINGSAFDYQNQISYAIDRVSNTLGTVDPITGSYTPIGSPGAMIGAAGGLASDPADGTLYTTFSGTGGFYIVDKASGSSTLISTNNVDYGLAFAPLPPPCVNKCCDDEADPMDLATESIVLIRDGEDRAQFKLHNVYEIKAAAYNAVDGVDEDGVTVQFGPCDDPICKLEIPASDLNVTYLNMRYTVGNVDVVRCIYGNRDKQECVINFRNDDFFKAHCGETYKEKLEEYFSDDGATKEMHVCLKVGGTAYSNTSNWVQQNSGSGGWSVPKGWTKYRYIPTP
ncbi:MAG: hypothetical protein D3904_01460 [Candidatus Electrothrix sp. EH2]|nr:hypothetical protein [Candidatus Electrothrix sp. EH2]